MGRKAFQTSDQPKLEIARQIGMYGCCKDLNATVDGQPFAVAHFDLYRRGWGVDVHNRDGSIGDYFIADNDADVIALEAVEALIRLAFRNNYAPNARVAA